MGILGNEEREVLERIGFRDGKQGSGIIRFLSRLLREENGAGKDPELALWMARGCCALGDYEHYHMAVRWLERGGSAACRDGEAEGMLALGHLYCGRPERALAHIENSVKLDWARPENWYTAAELRSFAGEKDRALEAVRRGRALGSGTEDWDILETQIREGADIREMEQARVRRRCLENGEQGSLLEKCRLEAADGLVCDRAGLEAVKAVLKPEIWDADAPYCAFCCWPGGRELTGAFYMNQAAVSRMDPEKIRRTLEDLPRLEREGKQALAENGAGDGELCLLEFYPDGTLGLVYETEEGEKKVPVSADGRTASEPESTASAGAVLWLESPAWDFEQMRKDLEKNWGMSCEGTAGDGVFSFQDGDLRVTASLSAAPEKSFGASLRPQAALVLMVLAGDGEQLEAELELERIIASCSGLKGVLGVRRGVEF